MEKLIEKVIEIVKLAGDEIQSIRKKGFSIFNKSDKSIVTDADLSSNRILKRLEYITDIPLLTEEESYEEYQESRKKYISVGRCWIVDPLDGTYDFGKGYDEFAISVALLSGNEPVLGVHYAPSLDILVYAFKDGGGFANLSGEIRPLCVSNEHNYAEMKLLVSRSEFDPDEHPYFYKIILDRGYKIEGKKSLDDRLIIKGSTVLKCTNIALGRGDYYFTLTQYSHKSKTIRCVKEWDIAASDVIIRSAGGQITDCRGEYLTYGKDDPKFQYGVFVSNMPNIEEHRKLIKYILRDIDLERIKMP